MANRYTVRNPKCPVCGKYLPAQDLGRPRITCSRACQGRLYRARARWARLFPDITALDLLGRPE